MRIIQLSSERNWRGGEQQIAYLIEGLLKLKIHTVAAVRKGSAFEEYCVQNGIEYYSLPFRNSFDIYTAWQLRRICKKNKIDIIHAHSAKSHGLSILANLLGSAFSIVLSRRVIFPPKTSFLTRFKYNHSSVKKIVCISKSSGESLNNVLRTHEKIEIIYSGIDLHKFNGIATKKLREEFNLNADTILIGNTSALSPEKDHITFLETVVKLRKDKIQVKAFIIGRGPTEASLRKYVTDNGLNDVVIFTGFRSDIHEILSSLDIFMITSTQEGLGTSVLDAFAAYVPVVATDAGGIPEIVHHRKTGMLARTKDSDQLAAFTEELIHDVTLRETLITNAKAMTENQFSKEIMIEKTVQVYANILRS